MLALWIFFDWGSADLEYTRFYVLGDYLTRPVSAQSSVDTFSVGGSNSVLLGVSSEYDNQASVGCSFDNTVNVASSE